MPTDQELEDFKKDMAANPALAPQASETDREGSVACSELGRRYRILELGDVICEGDEYLEDDAETWKPMPAMWWGTKYSPQVMKPCRGYSPTAPDQTLPH